MKSLIYTILIIPFVILSCSGNEESDQNDGIENIVTDSTAENNVENIDPPVNTFVIEENIVGIFTIGDKLPDPLPEELKTRQFIETDIDDDGNTKEHTHNVIFNMLEDVVELIMEKNQAKNHFDKRIVEMIVLSNYYQTEAGVGVGTTIEEFKEVYPDMSVWYDKIHNSYHVETNAILGVQFIFSELDVKRKAKGSADHQQINKSYIKEGAKIEKIRVH